MKIESLVSTPDRFDETFQNTRTDTYTLLAALLRQAPTAAFFHHLRRVKWQPNIPDDLADAWNELRQSSWHVSATTAALEFAVLFTGLEGGEVIPYASWYLDGLLMSQPLAHLRSDLRKLGISRSVESREAEDHAALVCETMALISAQAAIPIYTYARFFDQHVASWMFDFFRDLHKAPSARFYRSVARLGTCLLNAERICLDSRNSPAHLS